MADLPVDDRTHLVPLEHEVDGAGIALDEGYARNVLRRITSQPIETVGRERVDIAVQKVLPLLDDYIDFAERRLFGILRPRRHHVVDLKRIEI